MALNIRKFLEGIRLLPKSSTSIDSKGELEVIDSSGKLQYHNGTSASPVVTADHAETLENKTIDADNNTVSNLRDAEIASDADITRTKLAPGTANHVIINDGTGEVSSEEFLDKSRGGTGADTSSVTYPTTGTIVTEDGTQTLTNKTVDVTSNTVNGLTAGSVVVAGASGEVSEDNAGLFFDTTDNELGVGTATPATTVDVSGDFATRQTAEATTGNIDALDTSSSSSVRFTGAGAVTLRGIANGQDGKYLTIVNSTGNTLTVANEDANPSAANRIVTGTGADFTVSDGGSAFFQYDSTGQRWRAVSGAAGGGTPLTVEEEGSSVDTDVNTIDFVGEFVTATQTAAGEVEVEIDTRVSPSTKTSNYTVVDSDYGSVIAVDTTSGGVTITLPSPSAGFFVTVKDAVGNAGTNAINILTDNSEDIDGTTGSLELDTDYDAVTLVTDGTEWYRASSFTGDAPTPSGRGLFMGGSTSTDTIDYITISSAGNALDFGDLTVARNGGRMNASSTTRALCAGGGAYSNVIDYVEIATTGNATDFGDLTLARGSATANSNGTRAVFCGGFNGSNTNVMDYVTIATTGNATDFGDLTVSRRGIGSPASPTRIVVCGGFTSVRVNTMDYITTASVANATDFGDLTANRNNVTGTSSDTRGLIMGGSEGADVVTIEYITISSTGNSTDFGDLTVARNNLGSCSNNIRGVAAGGSTGVDSNVIDFVDIATLSNASDFGDLTVARTNMAGCSDSHGGVQ